MLCVGMYICLDVQKLARQRSLWLVNFYWQRFRPVGDFIFSWAEENLTLQRIQRETGTESLSDPINTKPLE